MEHSKNQKTRNNNKVQQKNFKFKQSFSQLQFSPLLSSPSLSALSSLLPKFKSKSSPNHKLQTSQDYSHGLCLFQFNQPQRRVSSTRFFRSRPPHRLPHLHHLWAPQPRPSSSISDHPSHSLHPRLHLPQPTSRTQSPLVRTGGHQLLGAHGRSRHGQFPLLSSAPTQTLPHQRFNL